MDESPNFYFSEEEAKHIIRLMGIAYGEGQNSNCTSMFEKIKRVYPDTIKNHDYILEEPSKYENIW